jgi:hypothetical protein
MLKDMTDSKRIDQHIQAQSEVSSFFPCLMPWLNDERSVYCIRRSFRDISGRLSKGISWSCQRNLKSEVVSLFVNAVSLTQARRVQDQYANGFTEFKPDKKLHWLPQLGTITLELELQDRTIEAEVTPLEATVIGLFEEKGAFQSPF